MRGVRRSPRQDPRRLRSTPQGQFRDFSFAVSLRRPDVPPWPRSDPFQLPACAVRFLPKAANLVNAVSFGKLRTGCKVPAFVMAITKAGMGSPCAVRRSAIRSSSEMIGMNTWRLIRLLQAMQFTPPVFEDVVEARERVSRHLPKTPLLKSWALSRLLRCEFYAKCENFLPVGAFKVRGGVNLVGTLSDDEKKAGVISASTGNHGQSIAFAGGLFGVRVVIYAPAENINALKLQAMRELGAEVRLHGRNFDEAREEVERVARIEGLRYIHSANEPKLIAGVGTMGLEIFEDLPDPDVIIVPVGAGSGACGNALVTRRLRPQTKVIGVQSSAAPAMWHAWRE